MTRPSLLITLAIASVLIIFYVLYWIKKHNPSLDYNELRNKNVIVTGASMGIGEQIAYEISKGGANLLITGLERDLLQNVAQKCKEYGCKSVKTVALDLSAKENCKIFQQFCLTTFENGKIHYLFLNHALIGPYMEWINPNNLNQFENSFEKHFELIEQTMKININSHILIATLLYKYLEVHKAKIIYVSSLAGYGIQPYVSWYSCSKHGTSAFFENWRLELAMNKSNISITICKLAMIKTNSSVIPSKGILSPYIVDNAADPNYIAKRIISGGQRRLKFVYAPFWDAFAVCVISAISTQLYQRITCKVNYKRFW